MRIVVIGASGHIGSYLVPRLAGAGHEVLGVSRGERRPYHPDPRWRGVEQIRLDREAEERAGRFGERIAALGAGAVIDLICFSVESATQLLEGLAAPRQGAVAGGRLPGRSPAGASPAASPPVVQLLHCGTVWVHGAAVEVPVSEDAVRSPLGDYGRKKAAIEQLLLGRAPGLGVQVSVLHPGHIVGPGWVPVNPAGNFDPSVFGRLARGDEVELPLLGLETLHHVHADDVALAFQLALEQPERSSGEAFHVASARALTLTGYAGAVAGWFGVEARLRLLEWEAFAHSTGQEQAEQSFEHVRHSTCVSIDKARRVLGYEPRFSSLAAVRESLGWLVATGVVDSGGRRLAAAG